MYIIEKNSCYEYVYCIMEKNLCYVYSIIEKNSCYAYYWEEIIHWIFLYVVMFQPKEILQKRFSMCFNCLKICKMLCYDSERKKKFN